MRTSIDADTAHPTAEQLARTFAQIRGVFARRSYKLGEEFLVHRIAGVNRLASLHINITDAVAAIRPTTLSS